MPIEDRFQGDVYPDATWGLCQIHNPVGIVRLVGEDGKPAAGGTCEMCHQEAHSEAFFSCPIHGINPRSKGRDGCPFPGCLGKSDGATEAEIARLADEIGRVWPGGPLAREDGVHEEILRPTGERAGEVGEGDADGARGVPGGDPQGAEERREVLPPPPPRDDAGAGERAGWSDPFLIEE